jgi:predicted metalloprotease
VGFVVGIVAFYCGGGVGCGGGGGQVVVVLVVVVVVLVSIEVEGISQVGGQDRKERHSGTTSLVLKHGVSMLQNVVDGAPMPHREG